MQGLPYFLSFELLQLSAMQLGEFMFYYTSDVEQLEQFYATSFIVVCNANGCTYDIGSGNKICSVRVLMYF